MLPVLSRRLLAVAGYVSGKVAADIGTDHGYLPIYLVGGGKCERAYACDAADGPLAAAKRNIEAYGLTDRIRTVKTDGMKAVEGKAETYIIAGMGGELIARIIAQSPFIRGGAYRLVLQPMTRAAYLRRFLFGAGFAVPRETVVAEDGRYYVVMLAVFDGVCRRRSAFEERCGAYEALDRVEDRSALRHYLQTLLREENKIRDGRERGGLDTAAQKEMIGALRRYLKENL